MYNKIELETFFQKSKGYYLEQYELYKNGHVLIFNLQAFIFNIFWYLFRKMYREFFGLLLYFIVQSIFVDYLILPQISIRNQGSINFFITNIIIKRNGPKIPELLNEFQELTKVEGSQGRNQGCDGTVVLYLKVDV